MIKQKKEGEEVVVLLQFWCCLLAGVFICTSHIYKQDFIFKTHTGSTDLFYYTDGPAAANKLFAADL